MSPVVLKRHANHTGFSLVLKSLQYLTKYKFCKPAPDQDFASFQKFDL
ncbi:hypothetical protein SAMN02745218_03019, partial [Desulfofundulus australicus DSM 11792]